MTADGEPQEPAGGGQPSFVKSFFRHGATYAFAGVLSQGIAFLLFPFFAHVFVPRDYAIIDLVALATMLVNLTIALEISQGLGRYFSGADGISEQRALVSTAFTFTAAVYTAALALGLLAAKPLGVLLFGRSETAIMRVAVGAMWCSGMLYLAQDLLRWRLRPKAFAVVSVLTIAVVTASSGILVLGFHTGVVGAIIGQLIGFASGGALAYWLSRDLFRFRFDGERFRLMVAYSIPLIPASVGVFLNTYADRIAIRSRLTLSDVGLYGVGYRLAIIVTLTLIGFQGALTPLTIARHEHPETPGDLARIFRLFSALALAVFLCLSLFADELLRLLTRPAYYGAARVVPLLAAGAFLAGASIFAPGLSIARRTRPAALVFGISSLLNLGLAFTLVGPFGIRGPAVAFLIGSAGSFSALMLLSQRHYHVPHRWPVLLAVASAIALIVGTGRLLLGGTGNPVDSIAKAGVAAAGLALIARSLLTARERSDLVLIARRSGCSLRSLPRTVRSRRRAKHA